MTRRTKIHPGLVRPPLRLARTEVRLVSCGAERPRHRYIFPFLRNCRIVYKVQRAQANDTRPDTPAVKLKSLLSPTNLARMGPLAVTLGKKSANVTGAAGRLDVVRRLHSDAGTAVQLLSLSPTAFHTRQRDGVSGPRTGRARPLKWAPDGGGRPTGKATPARKPNGRSIGRTRDNYYYRHAAIFRAGCKTARELR